MPKKLHYCMWKKPEDIHAVKDMHNIAETLNFEIVRSEPCMIADCWVFTVLNLKDENIHKLPKHVTFNP